MPRTHIDDEYAHAGERDPKILITTSRDPSSRLVQFAKEVKLLLPNSQRVNRGGMVSCVPAGTGAVAQGGAGRAEVGVGAGRGLCKAGRAPVLLARRPHAPQERLSGHTRGQRWSAKNLVVVGVDSCRAAAPPPPAGGV